MGTGLEFNAHNVQTIGFQSTFHPKCSCVSQLVMSPVQRVVEKEEIGKQTGTGEYE